MSYRQTIYNLLRAAGITEAGALGILGNWECESNNEPCRLQGDFQLPYKLSKEYAAAVDSGRMSISEFSRDQRGFGLAQWTYFQRKENMFNFAKGRGDSIADCNMQVLFAIWELSTENVALYEYLKQATAIWDACERVCKEYERPAINNVRARYEAAQRIRQELDLSGKTETSPEPVPPADDQTGQTPPAWATLPAWAPGVIEYGDKGVEVRLLQDLLCCRDYYVTPDGIFGRDTERKLKAFQQAAGLEPDGSCGPVTWDALKW